MNFKILIDKIITCLDKRSRHNPTKAKLAIYLAPKIYYGLMTSILCDNGCNEFRRELHSNNTVYGFPIFIGSGSLDGDHPEIQIVEVLS